MKNEIRYTGWDDLENSLFIRSFNMICKFTKKIWIKLFVFTFSIITISSCQSEEKIKLEQYYIGGKEVYELNCANCHQKDGKGLKNLYPPVAGSDYLKNKEKVIYILKNGLSGEILVNGKKYNQPMPANNQLTNLDIAEVVTYIYNEWNAETKITEVKDVVKVLNK
jgi:mono/diheme cytochrome c family protein|nr:cytochrome c [uncultured Emticicia sp.]